MDEEQKLRQLNSEIDQKLKESHRKLLVMAYNFGFSCAEAGTKRDQGQIELEHALDS